MTNKIFDTLVFGADLSVLVSIVVFLGSIVGFLFTGNPVFIAVAQYAMAGIFWTLVAALVIGPICTGFRGV